MSHDDAVNDLGGSARPHAASPDDLAFARRFEAAAVPPEAFDHAAHLRLAYVYLVESPDVSEATRKMRASLLAFLEARRIPPAKFHETLTQAWVLAVAHFMGRCRSACFAEFAARSAPLLDSRVMLTHYSAERLFSGVARARFVEPDLEAIPA